MSDPYIGEIRLWACPRLPTGWLWCDGSQQSTSTYAELFALIGTNYGGGGQTSFAVPDLRSRVPIHRGTGSFPIYANGGQETVTLTAQQNAAHTHAFMASNSAATSSTPGGNVLAASTGSTNFYRAGVTPAVALGPSSITPTGGSAAHPNVQPYQCLAYIIAWSGIYPTQG